MSGNHNKLSHFWQEFDVAFLLEGNFQNFGDFALVNPDEKHQYRNKGDRPFKMICGVTKEFE